jgi:membrane protein DedA with SNARE-associated domain
MGFVGGIAQWVTDVIASLGYVGVAALVALENLFPPIPSELILPLAGFLAGQGRFALPLVIVAATFGSTAGALAVYGIGAGLGERRVRALTARYGGFLRLSDEDIDRAESWFDRHGGEAVFLGHLAPLIRSVISIPAGLRRMPLWKFALYTAAGSGVWNSVLVTLGWALGDRWQQINQYASYFEYAVIAAIVGGIGWFVWKRRSG